MVLAQVVSKPAGGAALDQVALATGMALAATALLGLLVLRHVRTEGGLLARAALVAQRVDRLPGWAALPGMVTGVSLVVALVGMYWDIALHVDRGRDEGPLANPAHFLILAGLYGVFAAGVLSLALARGRRTGPSAVALGRGWHVPVGGLLLTGAAAFALVGFPLDDVWHRLFGQDVTLWGPTHLMLIGGAALALVGHAVLLMEGMRARSRAGRPLRGVAAALKLLRGASLMGGLLIGLSTFQAEFDFGIPQFRLVFQPVLIALAAGLALVAARVWLGPGGALGAVLFFLAVRGAVGAFVGVTGQTVPSLPLYLGEAVCVELAALVVLRRGHGALAVGALAGVLVGTVGFATEWAWSQVAMDLPWTTGLLPEAALAAPVAGVAGGLLGGLLGAALRSELPRPGVARPVVAVALVAVALLVANGLATTAGTPAQATVTAAPAGDGEARLTVRVDPPTVADGATWLTATSWQGNGLVVDRLVRVAPGTFRTTRPVPVAGEWKTLVRLHDGRALRALPVHLPADPAIPAPAVPVAPRAERAFGEELLLLQRERRTDVPGWLWVTASLVVLAIALAFIAVLCWGVARVARLTADGPPPAPTAPPAAPQVRPRSPAAAAVTPSAT